MESVARFLQDYRLGKKQVHRNLTLFPVLFPRIIDPYYLTLEQAFEKEVLVVTEVDSSGNVNLLKLRNDNKLPILLIEGEELQGAKQNRIINASFLIAGKTAIKIPVSCVEEQRWHYESQNFSSGKKVMHASLRREVQHCLHNNLSSGAGHRTDQGEIWHNIAAKSKRMKVKSPTMAMSDVFKHCEDRISEYSDRFHLMDHQVGVLFAIDGLVIGLECFVSNDTLGRFFKKLVKSYALDAIESVDEKAKVPSVPPAKAKAFVESIKKAKGQRHSVVSIGATISFESRITQGTALADGSKILHLSGFRKNDKLVSNGLGFQRFSARRNGRWRGQASG